MIKVKIQDLLNGTEALQKLSKMELKAKQAWTVSKLLKAADSEIQSFNETRMELIKKFGEKDANNELITDDKGNCKIPDGEIQEFSTQLNDLVLSEVEINANQLWINDIEDLEFTPAEMSALEPFIDFDEGELVADIPVTSE